MKPELEVSKLDAAKRQLEIAIRLYFSNDDPVSIHTLTAAAYNILRDVTEQKGADPMFIKGYMLEMVKPEHKKMIIEKVNEAENFFKHADRDHRATLSFNPDMTELHMNRCLRPVQQINWRATSAPYHLPSMDHRKPSRSLYCFR